MESIGIVFHLYPLPDSIFSWVTWVIYATSIVIVGLAGYRLRTALSGPEKILLSLFGISAAVMATAFIVTNFVSGVISARYIINIYYIGIVAFCTFSHRLWMSPSPLRWAVIVLVTGYAILAGFAAQDTKLRFNANTGTAKSMYNFLITENLRYGYSDIYWGFDNPAVLSLVSHGNLHLRTLSSNMGYLVPSGNARSILWDHQRPDFNPTFFMFSTNSREGAAAKRTFGLPDKIIDHGGYEFYIYHHNLSRDIERSIATSEKEWTAMNAARNIKGIRQACGSVGLNCHALIQAYKSILTWHAN